MDYIERYDSIADVLARLDRPRSDGAHDLSERYSAERSWDLGTGYARALTLLREGWADGARHAADIADSLRGTHAVLSKIRPAVTGGMVSVPAALAGSPLAFRRTVRPIGRGIRFLDLTVACGANCNVPAGELLNRAIAFACMVEALENHGYRARITCFWTTTTFEGTFTTTVQLKDYGQALNIADVAYGLGHPAFFRRLMFGIIERTDHRPAVAITHASYGTTIGMPHAHRSADSVVFSPTQASHVQSVESHLADIIRQLPTEARKALTPAA